MTSLAGILQRPFAGFLIATFQYFKNQAENVLGLTYQANVTEMVKKVRDLT